MSPEPVEQTQAELSNADVALVDWEPVVYIDRMYDDDWELAQPWLRPRRLPGDAEWQAYCEYGDHGESADFDNVEDALAWGHTRADYIFVRLGAAAEACFSAGSRPLTANRDGTGYGFAPWPPADWPEYQGPPEDGDPDAPQWLAQL